MNPKEPHQSILAAMLCADKTPESAVKQELLLER